MFQAPVNTMSFHRHCCLIMTPLVITYSSQEYNRHLLFNSTIHTDYAFIPLGDGCNRCPTVVYKARGTRSLLEDLVPFFCPLLNKENIAKPWSIPAGQRE